MINFSRPLTEIHGSILTTDDKQQIPESVIRAVREIRQRCQSPEEVSRINRDIHLFLFLNTDFSWPKQIEELDIVSCCVGLVNITRDIYLDIVRNELKWSELNGKSHDTF